jgi:hypothetical protein
LNEFPLVGLKLFIFLECAFVIDDLDCITGRTYAAQLKWMGMEDVRVVLTRTASSPLKEGDTPLHSRK